jgi:hypothetical protein
MATQSASKVPTLKSKLRRWPKHGLKTLEKSKIWIYFTLSVSVQVYLSLLSSSFGRTLCSKEQIPFDFSFVGIGIVSVTSFSSKPCRKRG